MTKRNSLAIAEEIREGEGLAAFANDPTPARNQLDLDRSALAECLFIGIYPGGIVYADNSRELDGDYRNVAFLDYETLEFDVRDPKSPLLELARKDAAGIQARRGESFSTSECGHTVLLGSKLK